MGWGWESPCLLPESPAAPWAFVGTGYLNSVSQNSLARSEAGAQAVPAGPWPCLPPSLPIHSPSPTPRMAETSPSGDLPHLISAQARLICEARTEKGQGITGRLSPSPGASCPLSLPPVSTSHPPCSPPDERRRQGPACVLRGCGPLGLFAASALQIP